MMFAQRSRAWRHWRRGSKAGERAPYASSAGRGAHLQSRVGDSGWPWSWPCGWSGAGAHRFPQSSRAGKPPPVAAWYQASSAFLDVDVDVDASEYLGEVPRFRR